jgi:hypothetical protein
MKPRPGYEETSILVDAIANCHGLNKSWEERHLDKLRDIEQNFLPSGSGFDSGCKVILDQSNRKRLVIETAFHPIDEHGFYMDWIHFDVIVTPTFGGIDIRTKGPFAKHNAMDLKDYIQDTFYNALTTTLPEAWRKGYMPGNVAANLFKEEK